ncbi:hypothetical protein VTL71DRAFT_11997 [Oculimacula yallundae]|uniref:Uncharacterized protein n=1 Tax=Oculimacula yallundae TaxID=86028 RepID=A0ABR4CRP1_9HELO
MISKLPVMLCPTFGETSQIKQHSVVYSILGLIQDPKFDRNIIVPDYQKTIVVVYAEAFIIRCERTIHALSNVDYRKNTSSDYGLPSWLPDWKSVSDNPILSYSVDSTSEHQFQATTSTGSLVIRISKDFRELQIAGVRIATIKTVVDKELRCAYATVKCDEGTDRETNVTESLRHITGKDDAELLLRNDEANRGGEECLRYWPKDEEQELFDHATNDQLIAVTLSPVGRLAGTEDGTLAIVNEVTVSGDVVLVPFGGQVPLILRPRGDQYVFIGECFVSGYMHGESVAGLRQESETSGVEVNKAEQGGHASNLVAESAYEASLLIEKMKSLSVTSEKWVQIGEVNKTSLPGKDGSTGEWFTLV